MKLHAERRTERASHIDDGYKIALVGKRSFYYVSARQRSPIKLEVTEQMMEAHQFKTEAEALSFVRLRLPTVTLGKDCRIIPPTREILRSAGVDPDTLELSKIGPHIAVTKLLL
jgi:hypothetical protein